MFETPMYNTMKINNFVIDKNANEMVNVKI